MASSLFNVNSVFNKYGIPLQSTKSNPNLINKDQSGMGNISSVAPNRVVPSSQINFFQDSAQRTAELTPPQNRGLLDPTDRNKFKQFGYSQSPTSQQTTQDPRPNVGNNLLSFGKKFTDFAGTPFGTGFAEGVGKFAGYSTMPTSFGQALASGLSSANANELAFLNAQPDRFEQFVKDGKLYNRNLKTDKVTQIGGDGTTITNTIDGNNKKFEDKYSETMGGGLGNDILKLRADSKQASKTQTQIDEYKGLMQGLDESDFGMASGIQVGVESFLNSFGLLGDAQKLQLGNKEALTSISGNFVLGFVQQTKGAISEREMAYFMMISAGLGRSKRGNELILDYMERINNRTYEKEEAVNKLLLSEDYQKADSNEKYVMYTKALSSIERQNLFTTEDRAEIRDIYNNEFENLDQSTLDRFERFLKDDDLTLESFEVNKDGSHYVVFKEIRDGETITAPLYLGKMKD